MVGTFRVYHLFTTSPFVHGALMFRREVLAEAGCYRTEKGVCRVEDYDLLMRLYARGVRGANIQEFLYEFLEDEASHRRRKYRYRINEARVRLRGFSDMGLMPLAAPYVVKPLIVGLLPWRLTDRLRDGRTVLRDAAGKQGLMAKLKDLVRGRYIALLKDAPVRLRAEHWQKRFDGDRAGAVLTALRMAAGSRQGPEEDIFACYPMKRFFDRQGFEELLSRRDVISFDVFDTLLLRRVDKPTDVFSLLEIEGAMPGFADARELAERQAREKKYAEKGTYEVTIDDIYRMPAMLSYGAPEELIERELSAERRVCCADPVMPGVVGRLLAAGKTVIATSDMYLPADFIRGLLESAGFHGIEKYFVSGDCGMGKGSGLFDAVRRYADGRSTVHIGDSFAGDVFPLRGSDILPIHYLVGRKRQKGEKG